ncbi:hypothetical protein HanXRQr2_Chr06g0252161 [Helianthus annuus]|uniref:DUF1997 family protein n=1 Tax=Helianthus annuus TaxID=4232 RepID=A0A251UHU1_HELAN|nr:uncharacterized protein LOC110865102 [Helianthus annuus]XP_021970004.1 uncharacterized protein LOC110865102 [Helianthus annuus]KAF5801792.1 hypothetical protein HanXRQr2_Chr06g0252161 [Helianthus annuus]KAJ0573031.1 hypothetical protein HanHA89_Chr06g0222291 [Helianthus annuus]
MPIGRSFCVCRHNILTVVMIVFKFEASLPSSIVFPETYPHQASSCNRFRSRRRLRVFSCSNDNFTESKVKKAKLSARKQERVKIPSYTITDGEGGKLYPIQEFLSHPSGIEALLNKHALQSVEQLDATTYRCTLPPLNLLNFEVSPVIDLRVTPTDKDCRVEMLSCKFEGSEIMERQNEHFSAEMSNYITWCTKTSEPYLDVDVNLDLTLEIYTRPFNMLPTSAVEAPGNLMMQALVDRLVPLLLQQLIQDYTKWVTQNPPIIPQNS